MLEKERIENCARNAAKIAYTVLGLDCPYSVTLIDDPTIPEDARLDTQKNEVQINLALLEPFSTDVMPAEELNTEEDKRIYEDYRHIMKIYSLVYHEMRHLYQKQCVTAYAINKKLGGGKTVPQMESDKKCALWLEEMKAPGPGQVIEDDANDFAYYLTNRYPIPLQMAQTNRRLGVMKRKYDKVEIPKNEKKSSTIDTSMNGLYTISEDSNTHQYINREEISKGLPVKKHSQEAALSLYCAWTLREGKCYEAIRGWLHTDEELKNAVHLDKVLKTLEDQLGKLTDGEYTKYSAARDAGEDGLDFPYWSEYQDIYFYIKDLRKGKYHGSNSLIYKGRRGIPRIETTGKRILDTLMDLIWTMDNGESEKDGLEAFWKNAEELMSKVNWEDWE